jgi:integrase
MATIGKLWLRNASAWYVTIDGVQTRIGLKKNMTEEEAEVERAKLLLQNKALESGGTDAGDNKQIKLLFGLWVDHAKQASPDQLKEKYNKPRHAFLQKFGDTLAKDIKSWHITDWLDEHKSWGGATKNNVISVIKKPFIFCYEREIISRNPFAAVKRYDTKVRGEEVVISADNYHKLRTAAKPYLRDIIDALWYSGARPSELLEAHITEYDAAEGEIDKDKHKTIGKGKKRKIYLPDNIRKIADRNIANGNEYLFPGESGRPIKRNDLHNRLLDLKKKAGIAEEVPIMPYGFRHTFACRLIQGGIPDTHVAAMLGHSSTKHLHKHYAHTLAMAKGLRPSYERAWEVMATAARQGQGQEPAA